MCVDLLPAFTDTASDLFFKKKQNNKNGFMLRSIGIISYAVIYMFLSIKISKDVYLMQNYANLNPKFLTETIW